jgi:DNA-binding transcriptional ArsR family regulator
MSYHRRVAPDQDTCDLLCLDLPKAESARREMVSPDELEAMAVAAKALADPTRLAVALALRSTGRACVCDLSWITGRSEKLISHHARTLKTAGLARSQRDGKMVMYELTPRGRALLSAVAREAERSP